jgi:hypothetical protein
MRLDAGDPIAFCGAKSLKALAQLDRSLLLLLPAILHGVILAKYGVFIDF